MEMKRLTAFYLVRLKNGAHSAVISQIIDSVNDFETDNPLFIQARTALCQAYDAESQIYGSYSSKDFTSDDLLKASMNLDNFMAAIRCSMRAQLYLPDVVGPLRREAEIAYHKFSDFRYKRSDGYSNKVSKAMIMIEAWEDQQEALTELGIWQWIERARSQVDLVFNLIEERINHMSLKRKGAMRAARKASDEAAERLFNVINSINTLSPSEDLATLTRFLLALRSRTKQYNLNTSDNSSSASENNSTETSDSHTES